VIAAVDGVRARAREAAADLHLTLPHRTMQRVIDAEVYLLQKEIDEVSTRLLNEGNTSSDPDLTAQVRGHLSAMRAVIHQLDAVIQAFP